MIKVKYDKVKYDKRQKKFPKEANMQNCIIIFIKFQLNYIVILFKTSSRSLFIISFKRKKLILVNWKRDWKIATVLTAHLCITYYMCFNPRIVLNTCSFINYIKYNDMFNTQYFMQKLLTQYLSQIHTSKF